MPQTKYAPTVTVEHDPETGEVLTVEIEWGDSQNYVEQVQEDGSLLSEDEAEELGRAFDAWRGSVASFGGVSRWKFTNHAATNSK